ncbi:MAG: CBS domain-containing protein [Deltaproteobacteria bacterium]|nr:CBS domain-containing protein [Deltaproteobacteria bacterium]
MRNIKEEVGRMTVTELLAILKKRKLPLIHEDADIREVVDAMICHECNRLLYVVDDNEKLTGVISLKILSRHVFSLSHEPQIHPRFLISMITADKAKDIMQKNTIVATEEEKVKQVLKRMIRTGVENIPVLDKEKRIIAYLTLADFLRFVVST